MQTSNNSTATRASLNSAKPKLASELFAASLIGACGKSANAATSIIKAAPSALRQVTGRVVGSAPLTQKMLNTKLLKTLGLGGAATGTAGLGGYMFGNSKGYDTGFGEGSQAGWVGGQQSALARAQQAASDQGFLGRLLNTIMPSNAPVYSIGTQGYSPEVAAALKSLSEALKTKKDA